MFYTLVSWLPYHLMQAFEWQMLTPQHVHCELQNIGTEYGNNSD